jgi:hypothetical protein
MRKLLPHGVVLVDITDIHQCRLLLRREVARRVVDDCSRHVCVCRGMKMRCRRRPFVDVATPFLFCDCD